MKTSRLLTICAALAFCGCTSRAVNSTDGHTSWLRACSADAECGSGLACDCGVCSRTCEAVTECPAFKQATCLPQATTGLSCNSPINSLCVATCNLDADCTEIGADARCQAGFCVRAPGESSLSSLATSNDTLDADSTTPSAAMGDGGGATGVVTETFDAGVGQPPSEEPVAVELPTAPTVVDQALELCGTPRQNVYLAASGEQLQSLLLGDWFVCTAGGFAGENEIGVRFLSGDKYELLYLDGDQLVTGDDAALRGTWQLGDNGTGSGGDPAILVQPASEPGSGWGVYTPRFSDEPLRLRIETEDEVELISASFLP